MTVRRAPVGSVAADAAVLQIYPEMEEYGYGQLRTVSKFISKVFLQLKCESGKDQAKCWGPIFPEGCRGVRGASSEIEGVKMSRKEREILYQMWGEDDAYEPVGFAHQSTRCRVQDLLEIQISNGRGDEDVVKRKLYNEDDNVSIVEERKDSEDNKDDVRESSEVDQFMMYKTYIDKYK